MDTNISHAGVAIAIAASNTTGGVPTPMLETNSDTDPVTSPDVTIGGFELDTNGNAVSWSIASPTQLVFSLTPGSPAQQMMHLIFQNNVTESGKKSVNDVISVTRILPNGAVLTAKRGKMISGPRLMNQGQGGRLSTMSYTMSFASVTETPAVVGLLG